MKPDTSNEKHNTRWLSKIGFELWIYKMFVGWGLKQSFDSSYADNLIDDVDDDVMRDEKW